MSGAFKFLVIADDSPEFPAALAYAALRAKLSGSAVLMLRVIEPEAPAAWVSVTEEIRRQAVEAAEALTQRYAAEVLAETGLKVEVVIREGDVRGEIKRLIEEDEAIRIITLAAGPGPGGPGPLVSSLARGLGFGTRALPVLVVPGGLSKEAIRALAEPGESHG